MQLDVQSAFEARAVRVGEGAPPGGIPGVPGKGEEGAAVHPLDRLFHLLAGDDAPVVLAQDDVDRAAQPGEQRDALHPEEDEDGEEAGEA